MRERKKRRRGDETPEDRRSPEGVRIIRADEAQAAIDAGQAAGRRGEDELRFGDVPPAPEGPRPSHRFPLPDTVDPAQAVPRRPVISAKRAQDERRPARRPPRVDPDQAHDPRPWDERVPQADEPATAAESPADELEDGTAVLPAAPDQPGADEPAAEGDEELAGAGWPSEAGDPASGYDPQGYEAPGYDPQGYEVPGYEHQAYAEQPPPAAAYEAPGYDVGGYDEGVSAYPPAWQEPIQQPAEPSGYDPAQPPPATPGWYPGSEQPGGYPADQPGGYGAPSSGWAGSEQPAHSGWSTPPPDQGGYPPSGYPGQAPPVAGQEPQAYDPQQYDPQQYDPRAYEPPPAYPPEGYQQPSAYAPESYQQPSGYPPEAYQPPSAYPPEGYQPPSAYPPEGYQSPSGYPPEASGSELPPPPAGEAPGYGAGTEPAGWEPSPAWRSWHAAPSESPAEWAWDPGRGEVSDDWAWPSEEAVAGAGDPPPAASESPLIPGDTAQHGDAEPPLPPPPIEDPVAPPAADAGRPEPAEAAAEPPSPPEPPAEAPAAEPEPVAAGAADQDVAETEPPPSGTASDVEPVVDETAEPAVADAVAEAEPGRDEAPEEPLPLEDVDGESTMALAPPDRAEAADEAAVAAAGAKRAAAEPEQDEGDEQGAEAPETEGASMAAAHDQGEDRDDADPPSLGLSVQGSTELPHWTDPPSGEMAAVGGEDDLSAWRALGSNATRWRGDGDWDEDVDYDDLNDEGARIGAMDTSRSDHSDLYSFDAEFEALEEERSGAHRTLHIDGEDAEEPAEREPVVVGAGRSARSGGQGGSSRPGERLRVPSGPGGGGRPSPGRPLAGGGDRNLGQAVITGVVLGAAVLVSVAIASWLTMLVSAVLVVACAAEGYGMMQRAGFRPATLLGLVATAGVMFAAYARGDAALPVVAAVMFVASMLWYLLQIVEARPLANVAVTTMTWLWIGLLGSYAGLLLRAHHGGGLFLGALIPVIAADVVALVAGRALGHRPLARTVSPGKTVEGVVAGAIAAIVAGLIVGKEIAPWGGLKHGLVLGVIVAILAPIGDLFESMIKRDLSIKDSGSVLPGHGGLLDRFDGVLLVLPAAYYLASYLHIVKV